MIALVFGWLITCALFYTLVNNLGEPNGHTFSYEAGHHRGVIDAQEDGVKGQDEIEASGIASYLQARRSYDVDLLEYCAGYVAGYAMYLNGFI